MYFKHNGTPSTMIIVLLLLTHELDCDTDGGRLGVELMVFR